MLASDPLALLSGHTTGFSPVRKTNFLLVQLTVTYQSNCLQDASYGGLNKNVLHRLRYLNPWSLPVDIVWGGHGIFRECRLSGRNISLGRGEFTATKSNETAPHDGRGQGHQQGASLGPQVLPASPPSMWLVLKWM